MKAGRDRDVAQRMIGGVSQIRDRDRLARCRGLAEGAAVRVDRKPRPVGRFIDPDRLGQVENRCFAAS